MGKEICLGCSKKFTKSDFSAQCTVCGLWVHKTCADMSDDLYHMLERLKKDTGTTYWACRACTAYTQGMNHRIRQIEEELEEVKKQTANNTDKLGALDKKVDDLAAAAAVVEIGRAHV